MTNVAPGSDAPDSFDEVLRRTLHVSKWTPGLTLLYFHTPHESLDKGQLVGAPAIAFRQCKTFKDEKIVRWLALYHPVEIDMGKSDPKTAERLGCKDGVVFAVVDQDLRVLATSKPLLEKPELMGFMKTTLQSDVCKSSWALVQKEIDDQKATLDRARALAKQDKWKEAAEEYKAVINARCKIADFYDEAVKEADKAVRKAEQAK